MQKQLKHRQAFIKAFMLMCVYAIHLVFFQAAMASSNDGVGKYFKTYLSHKANHSKGKPSSAKFYLRVMNNTQAAERCTFVFANDALNHVHFPLVLNQLPPVSKWLVYAHIPQDAFKIYQRIRVFLI